MSKTAHLAFWILACLALRPAAAALPQYEAEVVNPDLDGGLELPGGRALLLWGTDATILLSQDGASWSHARTPGSADLAQVAPNADGSVLIAVGARGTVLRSIDRGRSWREARNADVADLRSVSFHAPTGAWIAVGARGHLLRSTDEGVSWKPLPSPLSSDLQSSFVDPSSRRLLIGGDEGVIGVSKDGGNSWDVTRIAMPDPVTPVTAFHRFGRLLLATSALGRFLVSTDDGSSWDLLQAESKAFWTDAGFDPLRQSIVLVGHNGDVLRSADQAETWQLSTVEIAGRRNYLAAVHFDPDSESLLTLGAGGVIARSVDGGASWTQASNDVREGLAGLMAADKRLVAFGAGGLVVSSVDSGAHWNHDRAALEQPMRQIAAAPGGALLASGSLGTLLRSEDRGQSWRMLEVAWPNEHTPPDLRVLTPAPAGDALIAAGPQAAILRSNADASAWQVAWWSELEADQAIPWMLEDRARNLLVAIEAHGRLQVSRDGGAHWQSAPVGFSLDDRLLWQGVAHAASGTLLIAGQGGLAARSSDGARSWSRIDTGTDKNLYGSYADSGTRMFLMGQDGTLLRSDDLAVSWRAVTSGSSAELRRMVRDPRSGALLCFGAHGAIVRSSDEGRSWRAVASGSDGVLRKALVESGTRNLLLVGGQGTLLRSADGGRSWHALPAHTTRHFSSGYVLADSGDVLLVGERIVRLVRR